MTELMRRRRAIMGGAKEEGGLPDIYQQVTSITSNGSQYLSLGIKLTNNDTVRITGYCDGGNKPAGIFGATDGNGNDYAVQFQADDKGHLLYGETNYTLNTFFKASIKAFEITPTGYSLTSSKGTVSGSISALEFETGPIYLFWANGVANKIKFSCSAFEVVGKCNLIPCYRKSDTVIGMYDTVTKTFFTNAGSGSFTKGADV